MAHDGLNLEVLNRVKNIVLHGKKKKATSGRTGGARAPVPPSGSGPDVSHLRKTPRMLTNIPRLLTNTYEFLAIIANRRRIACVNPFASIFA